MFDHCVSCVRVSAALPDLPFAGYIQAKSTVDIANLQRWLVAKWTPVGSKLCSNGQILEDLDEFIAPSDSTASCIFLCTCPRDGRKEETTQGPHSKLLRNIHSVLVSCNVKLPCWKCMIVARYVTFLPFIEIQSSLCTNTLLTNH